MDENSVNREKKSENLPGRPVSLWIAATPDTDYPQLPENLSVDVVVLGGGITGWP